jgi:hypothetical protein|tara:strand:- start:1553 stop:2350 length:798 start_codon:yes stop_codon:yes gene_type:complete
MLGLGGHIQQDNIPKRAYTKGSTLLDGSNDYLKQDDGASIYDLISPASTSFSISLYFMVPGSGGVGTTVLMSKTGGSVSICWINLDNNGDLSLHSSRMIGSQLVNTVNAVWDTNLQKGTWYHITITCDRSGTNSDSKAYVDGNIASLTTHSTTASNVDLQNNSAYLTMGTFNLSALHIAYYNVHVDEIGVWNSVLSAAEAEEIADKYPLLSQNVGAYVSSGNLLRYYRMGQDNSSSAVSIDDMSGNGGPPLLGINSPTTSTTTPY